MIPVHTPEILESDIAAAVHALRTGMVSGTSGANLPAFESACAASCGVRHGIATANGTCALTLALAALGIGPGDEVLVPTLTNIATCVAVVHVGATPVCTEVEHETGNMDPRLLEPLITPRTRAIVPVHLYGHPVDMDPLMAFARAHELFVVEDAAEAHGAEYGGKRVGGFGHINALSFYANKVITTGEGGMVVTDDPHLAEKARSLGSLAYGKTRRFLHEAVGYNFRMTNIQAGLGLGQISRLDGIVEKKRQIARWYLERLDRTPGLILPVERAGSKNVYWMFCVVLAPTAPRTREDLTARLRERGVDTRSFFEPIHTQPALKERGYFQGISLPVAESLARRGFYLPSSNTLEEADVDRICSLLHQALES